MKIGTREIGNSQPCYIIAEAGTAYAGESNNARMLNAVEHAVMAKKAGADAVKFQMFAGPEALFCPVAGDEKRWLRWAQTFMNLESWAAVKSVCETNGITFLASAFQPTAVQWLKDLNVAAYKVASRAAATYPYDAVPGPFIVSDGMVKGDVFNGIRLQCVSKYPTPLAEAQWNGSFSLANFGLSDHSGTIWPGLDAMARGAPLLEVHYAIDKSDAGNDAPVCLSVDRLKLLCEARDAFHTMRAHPR
jgi:N,N'-diacetyllegionaminate synthase